MATTSVLSKSQLETSVERLSKAKKRPEIKQDEEPPITTSTGPHKKVRGCSPRLFGKKPVPEESKKKPEEEKEKDSMIKNNSASHQKNKGKSLSKGVFCSFLHDINQTLAQISKEFSAAGPTQQTFLNSPARHPAATSGEKNTSASALSPGHFPEDYQEEGLTIIGHQVKRSPSPQKSKKIANNFNEKQNEAAVGNGDEAQTKSNGEIKDESQQQTNHEETKCSMKRFALEAREESIRKMMVQQRKEEFKECIVNLHHDQLLEFENEKIRAFMRPLEYSFEPSQRCQNGIQEESEFVKIFFGLFHFEKRCVVQRDELRELCSKEMEEEVLTEEKERNAILEELYKISAEIKRIHELQEKIAKEMEETQKLEALEREEKILQSETEDWMKLEKQEIGEGNVITLILEEKVEREKVVKECADENCSNVTAFEEELEVLRQKQKQREEDEKQRKAKLARRAASKSMIVGVREAVNAAKKRKPEGDEDFSKTTNFEGGQLHFLHLPTDEQKPAGVTKEKEDENSKKVDDEKRTEHPPSSFAETQKYAEATAESMIDTKTKKEIEQTTGENESSHAVGSEVIKKPHAMSTIIPTPSTTKPVRQRTQTMVVSSASSKPFGSWSKAPSSGAAVPSTVRNLPPKQPPQQSSANTKDHEIASEKKEEADKEKETPITNVSSSSVAPPEGTTVGLNTKGIVKRSAAKSVFVKPSGIEPGASGSSGKSTGMVRTRQQTMIAKKPLGL